MTFYVQIGLLNANFVYICPENFWETGGGAIQDLPQVQDRNKYQDPTARIFILNSLQHPVTWQPSSDGAKMVGHMVLKKDSNAPGHVSSAAILGLKIVGGKTLENGKLGAIVEKVKRGSIADSVGHLRPGTSLIKKKQRRNHHKGCLLVGGACPSP